MQVPALSRRVAQPQEREGQDDTYEQVEGLVIYWGGGACVDACLSPLQAQYNPIAFGIIAGGTVPLGDFGDAVKTGWHAGALAQWNGAAFPLGIRGEVVYHSLGSESGTFEDVDFDIITATVNGVFMFPMSGPATVRPYIIGGGGLYRVGCSDCGDLDSENKGGINAGAGVQIPLSGFTSLIEGRWHMIFDSDDTHRGRLEHDLYFTIGRIAFQIGLPHR